MNADRLKALWELVAEVMETEEEQRVAVIERGCAGDERLRAEVMRLVSHAKRAESERFLETEDPFDRSPEEAGLPVAVGPYRVLGLLGEGGSGTVYRATREGAESREVAVKLLHAGMASRAMLARFDAERRALASLDHPAVAQVLDAGVTHDGRHYTVMNLFQGDAITEYAKAHALGWQERVGLVQRACEGVQHAHQRGVVHRDLKPGNILVAGPPADPAVCVIDFGTAKLLGDRVGLTTLDGRLMGTLPYMSPEQVSGVRVADIRTDVYGMAVVLFELLEGRAPHGDGSGPLPELVACIQSAALPDIREVPGRAGRDLTAVCRCAAAKKIDDRYASIGEFSEDLLRVLRDEPTVARHPPALERAARAMRRAWLPVSVALIIGALLTAFAVRATLAGRESERQRALLAETVKNINRGVLREIKALSGAADARAALAQGLLEPLNHLEEEVLKDPDLVVARYQVIGELGDLALQRSDWDAALGHRTDALRAIGGLAARSEDVEVHRSWAEAIVKVGDVLLTMAEGAGEGPEAAGKRSSGRKLYEQAFEIHQKLAAAHPSHTGVKDDLCYSLARLVQFVKADGDHQRVIDMIWQRQEIAKTILAAEPDNQMRIRNVIDGYKGIAAELTQAHRYTEAMENLGGAIVLADRQCQQLPGRLDFCEMRFTVYQQAYDVAKKLGDRERARGFFVAVEADARRVLASNPGRKDLDWLASWVKSAPEELAGPG